MLMTNRSRGMAREGFRKLCVDSTHEILPSLREVNNRKIRGSFRQ